MSKFLKLLNSVLNEKENLDMSPQEGSDITPTSMDSEVSSALPEEDEVALDTIKYKTLLKALKKALYNSYPNNLEKQTQISKIKVDSDDLKRLQFAENSLMSLLDDEEFIPSTEE